MPSETENLEEKAIRLLNRQVDELKDIRVLNYQNPKFKAWHDATLSTLQRFLAPDSPHLMRFRNLRFSGPARIVPRGVRIHPDYISPEDADQFQRSCQTSEESLRAALREIEDFGIHIEQARPALGQGRSRSVSRARGEIVGGSVIQNYHGPVTIQNQAIATDNAIQRIGQMGNTIGASLREIADLLRQSEDLTPRQVKEGLAGIEGLAVEVQKPEPTWNWKSILDSGQKILDVASKATDLALKLAPYTPPIATLLDKARHILG